MNYLTELMNARNLTAVDVARMSGLNVSTVRYVMEQETAEHCYKKTQIALADALGVTPRELTKGGKTMKDKILKSELETAVERLISAARKYTDKQVYVDVCFFTHDADCVSDDFPNQIPDYYSYRVSIMDEGASDDLPVVPIISECGRIYYSTDDGEERIRQVIPYGSPHGIEGVEENE